MRCFYHPAVEAVGLCKHCSRGICPACAAEVSGGIACKDRHEAEVETVSQMVRRSVATNGKVGPRQVVMTIVYTVGAVVFGVVAATAVQQRNWVVAGLSALATVYFGSCALAMGRWITAGAPRKAE